MKEGVGMLAFFFGLLGCVMGGVFTGLVSVALGRLRDTVCVARIVSMVPVD